jgi:uncharacterized membrane protein
VYLAMKSLHILGAVIFIGNIITSAFWRAHMENPGVDRMRMHFLAGITRGDRWFTLPGLFLIIGTGVAMAMLAGFPMLRTTWIVASIGILLLVGLVYHFALAPLQKRMRAQLLAGAETASPANGDYASLSWRWQIWAAIVIGLLVVALALMVFKPS